MQQLHTTNDDAMPFLPCCINVPGVDIRQDLGRVVNPIHVSAGRCNHAPVVTFVLECQMVSRGLVDSILSWEMNSVVEEAGVKGQCC